MMQHIKRRRRCVGIFNAAVGTGRPVRMGGVGWSLWRSCLCAVASRLRVSLRRSVVMPFESGGCSFVAVNSPYLF
jgi:hypothetical protein